MREPSVLNLVMGSVRVGEHELNSLFFSSWTQTWLTRDVQGAGVLGEPFTRPDGGAQSYHVGGAKYAVAMHSRTASSCVMVFRSNAREGEGGASSKGGRRPGEAWLGGGRGETP